MNKNVVILAGGKGTKIWPYSEVRNKAMIPVANKPIIAHNIDSCISLGADNILILAGPHKNEIKHYFAKNKKVTVIDLPETNGTVDSLLFAKKIIETFKDFFVLYADTIINLDDLKTFLKSKTNSILLSKLKDDTGSHIGVNLVDNKIEQILAHPRDGINNIFAGFHFDSDVWDYLTSCDSIIRDTQVGMMSPEERFIESSISDMIKDNIKFNIFCTLKEFYDIDKPWHILEANDAIVKAMCNTLKKNEIGTNSSIDESSNIRGFVKLGNNSRIGKNVIIEGNIIVGDNTTIDNGAMIQENVVIGNNVTISYCCFIASGSTIGNECFIGHAAEIYGVLIRRVFLYHYMEIFGIVGENVDIGAGTLCGTLRFDDGFSIHRVNGRREIPRTHSDSIYIGDFSRTGVGALLYPGIKIGAYSLVGPGVSLTKDLPSRKAIFIKQDHEFKDWGPERYGW